MTRIFCPIPDGGETVVIEGADSVHIACALRMRPGERLILCDGGGVDCLCEITSATAKQTVCRLIEKLPSPQPLKVRVHLLQSLPKSDKFEFIIQKCTELGIHAITPVISERCISRPDASSLSKKLTRWRQIAREASQQCGRGDIPEIYPAVSFSDACVSVPSDSLRIFCNEDERNTPLRSVIKQKDAFVFVGPEGGYSDDERRLAAENGLTSVSLGSRILRCETAPVFVMSCFAYEFG